MAEKYLVRLEDEDITLELDHSADGFRVRREGDSRWKAVELDRVGDSGLYLLMVDSRPIEIYLERRRGGAIVTIGRHAFNYDVGRWRPSAGPRSRHAATAGSRIAAPMTGSIVEVRCSPGDSVARGDVVLVIESMKMNNELRSPSDAVVESVAVKAGQRVKAGETLVSFRAVEA